MAPIIYAALANRNKFTVSDYVKIYPGHVNCVDDKLTINFPTSLIHIHTEEINSIVLYDADRDIRNCYPLSNTVPFNKSYVSDVIINLDLDSLRSFIKWARTVPNGADGSKKVKAPAKPWDTDSGILGSIHFPTPETETISNGLGQPIRTERNDPVGIERKRWRTADEWQAKLAKETTRKSLAESETEIYKRSCHRGQGVMFTGMAGALTVSFASPLLPLLFVIVSLSFCALALLSGLAVAAESSKKFSACAAEARQAQAELDGLYASPPPSQDV